MVKRTTAFAFILTASFLLLAVSVVPHHHHGNHICFATKHCTGDDSKDESPANGKNHHHHGDNDSDDCVLKAPAELLLKHHKPDFDLLSRITDSSASAGFNAAVLASIAEQETYLLSSLFFEQPEDHPDSSYLSESLKLRAPPVV